MQAVQVRYHERDSGDSFAGKVRDPALITIFIKYLDDNLQTRQTREL